MSEIKQRQTHDTTKKKPNAVRSVLTTSCIIYSVLVLSLCFILLFSGNASDVISPTNFLLVFPFSLCFAIANYVDKKAKISTLFRVLIHSVLTVGGFFCFLYLPAFPDSSDSGSMVVFVVFSVLYFLVYGTVLLFRHRWNKEVHLDAEYTPHFSSKEDRNTTRRNGKS